MSDQHRLSPDELYARCDPETLGFETTAEISPLEGVLGQDEAMEALAFGISISSPGFNLFVLGQHGSGRHTFVRQALRSRAADEPTPPDWCYVADFQDPRRPRALKLPPGRSMDLRDDMEQLTVDLRASIPRTLESEEVAARRTAIAEEHARVATSVVERFREEVEADGLVALAGSADSMMIVPARDGEPLTREAYNALPEETQDAIDQRAREGTKRLMAVQREVHQIRREAQARVEALHIDVTERLVRHRLDVIKGRYEGIEVVESFLDDVRQDVVKHVARFTGSPALDEQEAGPAFATPEEDFFRRYQVNPMVCHKPGSGAPLVEETNPNVRNLLGRVEGQIRFGVMVTDFTRIARGALHQANGGYLILDAEELLSRPMGWPSLKRVLRTHELRPADPAADIGVLVTESLEPQAIPADVKVVLIGRPRTYYTLQALDPDFPELFKVKVDFASDMQRTAAAERGYAAFVAGGSSREELPAFDAPAVARIVEEASRLASDQKKLTTRFRGVVDLIREAAHRAREAGRETVGLEDVDMAVRRRHHRESRPHREILDLLGRGVLAFSPQGEASGRLWGIGLLSLNDRAFGRPMSVTASAYAGGRGVINIERETAMSGPIHSKGVLLLQGYLGRMFARRDPLVLSASMSFDQLYEEVEGDSASVAELYALMSAIGDVPLRQDLAVTGALNQQGQVLPVGGVTEKVEGFFDACMTVGMTGTQGVILPRRNVDNLVLREDVRRAVEEGRFAVYAIDRVEEGWPILAGLEAGVADEEGDFPEGTVHDLVAEQLRLWREGWRSGGDDEDIDVDVDELAAALMETEEEDEEEKIPGAPDLPDVETPVAPERREE